MIFCLMLTDLTYYIIHRFLYHYKNNRFYKLHRVHHRVQVLDYMRGNFGAMIDNGVLSYPLHCAVYGYIMHLDLNHTLVVYFIMLLLQIVHHANFTFKIGYLRYIFIDNHCHKIHHIVNGKNVNFGGVLSIWDLLFMTYYENHNECPNYLHKNKMLLYNQ